MSKFLADIHKRRRLPGQDQPPFTYDERITGSSMSEGNNNRNNFCAVPTLHSQRWEPAGWDHCECRLSEYSPPLHATMVSDLNKSYSSFVSPHALHSDAGSSFNRDANFFGNTSENNKAVTESYKPDEWFEPALSRNKLDFNSVEYQRSLQKRPILSNSTLGTGNYATNVTPPIPNLTENSSSKSNLSTFSRPSTWSISMSPPRRITTCENIAESDSSSRASNPSIKEMWTEEVFVAFAEYVPLLKEVQWRNSSEFLAHCLRQHHEHVSLDAFCKLLFDWTSTRLKYCSRYQGPKNNLKKQVAEESLSTKLEYQELAFCDIVLNSFKDPEFAARNFPEAHITNDMFAYANFHEIVRNFLALKIIFASVVEVDRPLVKAISVPGNSLYNAYYILCQNLMHNNSAISNYPEFEKNVVLSRHQLGKLVCLAFPGLAKKRLGARGHSKSHYMNITWRKTKIIQDILPIVELEFAQLQQYFRTKPGASQLNSIPTPKLPRSHPINISGTKSEIDTTNEMKTSMRPSHSFVELSHSYPSSHCAPRSWTELPNTIPKQSEWSILRMEVSLQALKSHKVDLGPLIKSFDSGTFFGQEKDILSTTLMQCMDVLSRASAPKNIYLHLYLVILLLVFPVSLSSDYEVPVVLKGQFRESITKCVTMLEAKRPYFENIDEASLSTFMGILKKMGALNKMTSVQSKINCKHTLLNSMIRDFEKTCEVQEDFMTPTLPLEEGFLNVIIWSMNAYNFEFKNEASPGDQNDTIEMISACTKVLSRLMDAGKQKMLKLPQSSRNKGKEMGADIPFQLLMVALDNFHRIVLTDPLVRQLPMKVFRVMMTSISKSIQSVNLSFLAKRDPELSKETFKCWWVAAVMVQEYVTILAEVVALSETVSGSPSGL